jgi:hypothetical protein
METITRNEWSLMLDCLNESFYSATKELERKDLGNIEQKLLEMKQEHTKALIIKLEPILDKMH